MTRPDAPLPALGLAASGLAARRGERLLFEGLDFTLEAGAMLVVTGPNGAGKTTLLRLLAGALAPEKGRIAWTGDDPEARPETRIHLLAHRAAIKPRLTLAEDLGFWQAMNGPGLDILAALERVGLGGLDWLEAGLLSAGQQRRLALARLLASRRPAWLLDEPLAALDRQGEALLLDLLAEHLEAGGLVVAATHQPLPLAAPSRQLRLGEAA